MKILINVISARNIGGGFQVVYNFIIKTLEYIREDVEWYYAVSERLDFELSDDFKDKVVAGHYFVFPDQPDFRSTFWRVTKEMRQLENEINPDIVFSPLAPGYFFFKHTEVMRFANAWSTNATTYAWKTLPLQPKIRMWLYNIMQRSLLRRAKYIITQTETVKGGLLRVTNLPDNRIKVVPNVLPAVFLTMNRLHIDSDDKWVNVACIGGQMPHKNFDIIPEVLMALAKTYNLNNIRFHTTIPVTTKLWKRLESRLEELGYEERVVNYGNLDLNQLAELYRRCNVCFLPSVLETFSASTIEAMYFNLQTVATDLPFNKEVLGNACLYYEPLNAQSAAKQMANLLNDKIIQQQFCEEMKIRLQRFVDFQKYFNDTVDYLIAVANGEIK